MAGNLPEYIPVLKNRPTHCNYAVVGLTYERAQSYAYFLGGLGSLYQSNQEPNRGTAEKG